MKKHLFIAISYAILLGLLIGAYKLYESEKNERIRQQRNVETLNSTVLKSKVRDSLNVASINALSYTVDELKQYRSEDAQLIKDLKIKNKDLKAYAKIKTETRDTITRPEWKILKDTGCLSYEDKWTSITACFKDSTVMFANRDSLAFAIENIPKHRFLWWRWERKRYRF